MWVFFTAGHSDCTIAHVAVRKHHQRQDEIIIFFTHTILESAKLFFLQVHMHFLQAYVVWNARIYSKHASICCAYWIELRVEGVYCTAELFWKQLFEWSAGRNIPDFVTATSAIMHRGWKNNLLQTPHGHILLSSDFSFHSMYTYEYKSKALVTTHFSFILKWNYCICMQLMHQILRFHSKGDFYITLAFNQRVEILNSVAKTVMFLCFIHDFHLHYF